MLQAIIKVATKIMFFTIVFFILSLSLSLLYLLIRRCCSKFNPSPSSTFLILMGTESQTKKRRSLLLMV